MTTEHGAEKRSYPGVASIGKRVAEPADGSAPSTKGDVTD
jgi:hypothetical protein